MQPAQSSTANNPAIAAGEVRGWYIGAIKGDVR
jgi:hypothetical protein